MTPRPSPTLRDSSTVFFIATQYFGAFNDNIFKQLMLLVAVFATGSDQQSLASMTFSLPFILFSGYAGQFAERFSKIQACNLNMGWCAHRADIESG